MSQFYNASVYANLYGALWAPRGDGRNPNEWVRLEAFDQHGQPVACNETYSRTKIREPQGLYDPVFVIKMRPNVFFREVEHVTRATTEPPGFLIGTGVIFLKDYKVSTQDIVNAVQSSSSSAGCLLMITSAVSVLSGVVAFIAIGVF